MRGSTIALVICGLFVVSSIAGKYDKGRKMKDLPKNYRNMAEHNLKLAIAKLNDPDASRIYARRDKENTMFGTVPGGPDGAFWSMFWDNEGFCPVKFKVTSGKVEIFPRDGQCFPKPHK